MVRIPAFHAGGPGSIPGVGKVSFSILLEKILIILLFTIHMMQKRIFSNKIEKETFPTPGIEPGPPA